MLVIREADNPGFFRYVTDGNLLRQYDFLETTVQVALTRAGFVIGHDLIKELNNYAVVWLSETNGRYRECPIYIKNSPHQPPNHKEVRELMEECLRYVAEHFAARDALHLAAYMLWRLCWIHPFEEGNGRTARAACYLVLCLKTGMWLPGKSPVHKQIRENRGPYIAALRAADAAHAGGQLDLSDLERYLGELLKAQLAE